MAIALLEDVDFTSASCLVLPPVLTREGQSILCLVLAAQLPSWASDFFVIAQPSKGEVSSRRFVTCGSYLQDNCPERVMTIFVMQANNLTLSILSIRFLDHQLCHTHPRVLSLRA